MKTVVSSRTITHEKLYLFFFCVSLEICRSALPSKLFIFIYLFFLVLSVTS